MRNVVRSMFSDLQPWGRFWLALGLGTLACAAAMSFSFGSEISYKHALFLVGLSIIAACLPEAAYAQWTAGRRIVGSILAAIALPVLVIEFYTHAGYTAGLRGSNIETASVQNARYDARQDEVREGRASHAMWTKRLADLQAAHGWTATVTAEQLRAEEAAEAKRGGCGQKCLAIRARIAVAEEMNKIREQIEATKRVVDASREKAVTTEHKSSAVAHQNEFLARTVALVTVGSLRPSEIMTEGAQQTVNLAMALAGTGLPALALFVAGLYRRQEEVPPPAAAPEQQAAAAKPSAPAARPIALHTATVADLRRLAA